MMNAKSLQIGVLGFVLVPLIAGSLYLWGKSHTLPDQGDAGTLMEFDSQRAIDDVSYQVSLGARIPGSVSHRLTGDWIANQLMDAGWNVEIQETSYRSHPIRNIIARWGEGSPWVVLGAHYDSRIMADRDPDPSLRELPVPGANDGASGVAVLLELARVLPARMDTEKYFVKPCWGQVWLVFLDAEDQGGLPGWDWILGSQTFVDSLKVYPNAAIIIDMIGDGDLDIYVEKNSNAELSNQIWTEAAALGHSEFVSFPRYQLLDDHIPFLEVGIPAALVIDFNYSYWHTSQDTLDKVSARSLKIVGETILAWLSSCGVK